MKKIVIYFTCVFVGLVFVASAWFKLNPIEPFEYKIVGTTFISWIPSVFVARIIIGVEFWLGALLISGLAPRKALYYSIGILGLFTLHLVIDYFIHGNASNCACFGEVIHFSTLQGILKNVLLIALCLLLVKHIKKSANEKRSFSFLLLIISITAVFIVNPIDLNYSERYLSKSFHTFNLPIQKLYDPGNYSKKVHKPAQDIRTKKYIVSFLSATCPHCKIAAQKIAVINRINPFIPFYFFINGDDSAITKFLEITETKGIPHSKLNGHLFVEMAGLNLPVIYYLNKGVVEQKVDYFTLEQYHIEKWLSHRKN
jgi:hypothetical protein